MYHNPAKLRALATKLRDGGWATRRRIRDYSLILLALYVLLWPAWLAMGEGLLDPRGKPIGSDFVNVHAAARQTLAGTPAEAYDVPRHLAAEAESLGQTSPLFTWHYPPWFQMLTAPLGLLSYLPALIVYMAATLAAYLLVMARLLPWPALLPAAAFPAVFVNLAHGQNGFLTTALFGGGLLLMRRFPIAAGILFGVLTIKPQLGVLLPLALAIDRRWRTIAAAAAAIAVLALASLLTLGIDTWAGFRQSLALSARLTTENLIGWEKIQSISAAVRLLGGGEDLAFVLQAAVAVVAAAAVAYVWWRRADWDVKVAALGAGTLLCTPYVVDYDLVLLGLPIACLARTGLTSGFLAWERTLLAAAWISPLFARSLGQIGVPVEPLVIAALLALAVRRAARA